MHASRASPSVCGFLRIPIEVRTRIYALVLRPDCTLENHGDYNRCRKPHQHPRSFLGCTKILSVCRLFYVEAIEVLHNLKQEPALAIDGQFKYALRRPLEFGKPGYFHVTKNTSRCYIPKIYDELQIIRMRRFALHVTIPELTSVTEFTTTLARLANNVKEIATALAKSKTMKVLCLKVSCVEPDYARDPKNEYELRVKSVMHNVLTTIIAAARRSGFDLIVQNGNRVWPETPPEPLIEWLASRAINADVKVTTVEPQYHEVPHYVWDCQIANCERCEAANAQGESDPFLTATDSKPLCCNTMLEEDIPHPIAPAAPYELVPQCRFQDCNAYFRDKAELMAHLRRYPYHKQRFVKKTFNTLHPSEHGAVGRRCWTCAKPYGILESLEKHLDQTGHRRYGIIPKYREDNEQFNENWKKHKERTGWL